MFLAENEANLILYFAHQVLSWRFGSRPIKMAEVLAQFTNILVVLLLVAALGLGSVFVLSAQIAFFLLVRGSLLYPWLGRDAVDL